MAFVGNPCPQIYNPMNLYTINCLIFIKIIPIKLPAKSRPHEPEKLWLLMNKNDSTVGREYIIITVEYAVCIHVFFIHRTCVNYELS